MEAVRQRILDRAGVQTTHDPGVNIHFKTCYAIIASRSAVRREFFADPRDRRRLGVEISALRVGERSIPLDHPSLTEGWQELEPDSRLRKTHKKGGFEVAYIETDRSVRPAEKTTIVWTRPLLPTDIPLDQLPY